MTSSIRLSRLPLSRRLRRVLVPLALGLAAGPLAAQVGGIPLGAKGPSAMVETLDGKPVDLATLYGRGKPTVIEFWATWCPLCRKLEPTMQAARAKFDGQVEFIHVGVSANQSPERQRAHATAAGMTGVLVFDRNDEAQRSFSALHTSYVVVLDPKGVVVYTGMGETQDIEAAIRKAMSAER